MSEQSSENFPIITEAGLDDLRKRIGVPITKSLEPDWIHGTKDAIKVWWMM